jgi:hypothetical protein
MPEVDLSTRAIENTHLRLEYMTAAGPRLLRLIEKNSQHNLFAEIPQVFWETSQGQYHPYGGHRLWLSPEVPECTYVPDNLPPQIEVLPDGVRLTRPVEVQTGMRKAMEVHLDPRRPIVTIDHILTNHGTGEVEYAPWAITQMASGGLAVAPDFPPDEIPVGAQADRILALWPYTRLNDPRLHFYNDLIVVKSNETIPPCKIGLRSIPAWLGYYRAGVYFRKTAQLLAGQPYPDFGCNLEVYVDNRFLELETLGPLTKLAPGQSLTHHETWQVWAGLDAPETPDAVAALARELQ